MDVSSGDSTASVTAAVDLFCGAGGLSFGMQRAGVTISAGIDVDPTCRFPFEANLDATFHELDASELEPEFVSSLYPDCEIRVLAGCAPCQPFSTYSGGRIDSRQRWLLLSKFAELVREVRPEIVTMENVPRLRRHSVFDEFLEALEESGYEVTHPDVKCAEYGVPQTRARLVLLASRLGKIELLPPDAVGDVTDTVRKAIGHLNRIGAGEVDSVDRLHQSSGLSETNVRRIRSSIPGGTWRDWKESLRAACHLRDSGKTYSGVYGRMKWDHPAPTITTQFHGFGNGRFGHPEQDRALSLREGALLQTFPEDYEFVAESDAVRIGPIARLIGNAVPVRLGEAIGRSIVSHVHTFE